MRLAKHFTCLEFDEAASKVSDTKPVTHASPQKG